MSACVFSPTNEHCYHPQKSGSFWMRDDGIVYICWNRCCWCNAWKDVPHGPWRELDKEPTWSKFEVQRHPDASVI